MRRGYRPCSIHTERQIPLSFSPYRSRRSSSSHARCALITQSYTENCKSIFSRTLWNILLNRALPRRRALPRSCRSSHENRSSPRWFLPRNPALCPRFSLFFLLSFLFWFEQVFSNTDAKTNTAMQEQYRHINLFKPRLTRRTFSDRCYRQKRLRQSDLRLPFQSTPPPVAGRLRLRR